MKCIKNKEFIMHFIKPAVGRMFLASFGKYSIITFQHKSSVLRDFCTSSWLCFQALENLARDGRLWPITGHFRERAFLLAVHSTEAAVNHLQTRITRSN